MISISFFNDRKVKAVWGEENSKWWFSVLNLIATINEQEGYQKARNYWKNLKTKLKRENNEQASRMNASDGKKEMLSPTTPYYQKTRWYQKGGMEENLERLLGIMLNLTKNNN